MDRVSQLNELLDQILYQYDQPELRVSEAYLDGGPAMLFQRLGRAAKNQVDDGDATLSRYGIWANTCRDHIRHALELMEEGNEREAKASLVKAANSLSAFSEIQALLDPYSDDVVHKDKKFRVIVGDSHEGFIQHALALTLRNLLPANYELDIEHSGSSSDLVRMAREEKPDLFILWLNNIITATNETPQERLESALGIILMLKANYPTPIMIISLYDGDPPMTGKLEAYADSFIKAPFIEAQIEAELGRLIGEL